MAMTLLMVKAAKEEATGNGIVVEECVGVMAIAVVDLTLVVTAVLAIDGAGPR